MPDDQGKGGQDGSQGQSGQDSSQQQRQRASDDASSGGGSDDSATVIARLNSEAKTHREAREAAERELSELKKGQMSELEKARAELEEAKAVNAKLDGELKTVAMRSALVAAAEKAKATDPSLVARTIDLSEVETDSDGKPTNLAKLMESLKKEHPILFQQVQGDADNGARQGGGRAAGGMNELIRRGARRA